MFSLDIGIKYWRYDELKDGITSPELCNALPDYITNFQNKFIREAEEQCGGLDNFYIAREKEYPLMAGLTYVERGLFKDAERCFSDSKMPLVHSLISFKAHTEEQVKRLKRDGINPFKHNDYYGFDKSEKQIFIEYARAMQCGCVWTEERLKFGEPM